jgi:hypothetical protein
MQVNVGDILTSCAILVALVTWWVAYQQARRSERAARTAEVIANLSTSEALAEATYQVTRLINGGKQVRYTSLDESTERHVVKILDYYEYMCELCDSGILSRETVVSLRGNLMARTYDACQDYILETRRRQGRQVYEAFERLVKGLPGRATDPQPLPDGSGSHQAEQKQRRMLFMRILKPVRSLPRRRP